MGRQVARALALTGLRAVAERFAGGRLPEWDAFAERAALWRYDPRQRMEEPGQVALILRGQAKLVTRDADGAETVEQFLGRGDLAASRVRPKWADASAPPFTISRWYGRRWSVPDMELHSLTRCVALQFDADFAAELSERHSGWARVYSAFVWSYVDIMWVLVKDARVKTAAERYAELMGRPSPPTAATQGEIASYLCISRQAFNRILAASSGSSQAEAAERPRAAREPS